MVNSAIGLLMQSRTEVSLQIEYACDWIKSGLEDWDITRDGPYFGFKIPGELDKFYYVWLDAPIGYIAASEKYAKDKLQRTAAIYWQSDCTITHFIKLSSH